MPVPGKHASLWIDTAPAKPRPALPGDASCDVAVVGAGICGLTAAYELARLGKSVMVLERLGIVQGVSGKTTAKVTLQHGVYYDDLVQRFGEDRARIHVAANTKGRETIEDLQKSLRAGAQFTVAPSYVYTTDASQVARLKREAEACRKLGLPAAYTQQTELPFAVAGAVLFEGQAHFHPRKYLLALAAACEREGVRIHESTPVVGLHDGEPCRLTTPLGTVTAKKVIVATNVPINEKAFYTMRMQAKREYVVVAPVGSGAKVRGMYVNCDEPRRSVRPFFDGSGDFLVFAGESHLIGKHEETQPHYEAIASFARRFGTEAPTFRWSTQDYYPVDDVPMVGRYSPVHKHTFTATGFRAWGMTMGTAAGLMLAELATKGESPWSGLYDPFGMRMAKTVTRPSTYELVGTAVQGLLLRRLRTDPKMELEPGQGRIMDMGMHKVATCRDRQGTMHAVLAKCSHMGCIVSWNTAEQSWDCPCHGSRFAPDGAVLRGPATQPLEPAKEPPLPAAK